MPRMKLFGSGSKKTLNCQQNPDTKELVCESFRENTDGTKVKLASVHAAIDASCTPVITDMEEYEEGELDILEKKVLPKLSAKCKRTDITSNKPQDY